MKWVLLAAALLAGCGASSAPEQAEDPLACLPDEAPREGPLRVLITPIAGAHTRTAGDLLDRYLEAALKIPVTVAVAESYETLQARLALPPGAEGAADVGVFAPLAFVRALDAIGGAPLACASSDGSPTYVGYLVVRGDRDDLNTLEDLRGRRIAWVDPLSTSGYLYPRALLRWRGHAAEGYFDETPRGDGLPFTGDHLSALRAVLEGRADVAAVSSTYVHQPPLLAGIDARALRVVAKTERIPMDCAVARADLSRSLAMRVREALLALGRHPEHAQSLGEYWGFAAFVPYEPSRYARIAEVLATEESAGL